MSISNFIVAYLKKCINNCLQILVLVHGILQNKKQNQVTGKYWNNHVTQGTKFQT